MQAFYRWEDIYKEARKRQEARDNGDEGAHSCVIVCKVLRKSPERGSYCESVSFGENHIDPSFFSRGCGCCSYQLDGDIVGYKIYLFDRDANIVEGAANS